MRTQLFQRRELITKQVYQMRAQVCPARKYDNEPQFIKSVRRSVKGVNWLLKPSLSNAQNGGLSGM